MSYPVRAIIAILLTFATALISASVLPWFPLLRWLPMIALVSVVLIVARVRPLYVLVFSVSTAVLADTLSGFPVGVRTIALLGGMVILWPLLRTYALHRHTIALLVMAVVLTGFEALAGTVAVGGFPPARWSAFFQALWPAMVWGVAVAVLLHRYVRQRV